MKVICTVEQSLCRSRIFVFIDGKGGLLPFDQPNTITSPETLCVEHIPAPQTAVHVSQSSARQLAVVGIVPLALPGASRAGLPFGLLVRRFRRDDGGATTNPCIRPHTGRVDNQGRASKHL